jgi:hypothetical protein
VQITFVFAMMGIFYLTVFKKGVLVWIAMIAPNGCLGISTLSKEQTVFTSLVWG